jgi:hypothetical protein
MCIKVDVMPVFSRHTCVLYHLIGIGQSITLATPDHLDVTVKLIGQIDDCRAHVPFKSYFNIIFASSLTVDLFTDFSTVETRRLIIANCLTNHLVQILMEAIYSFTLVTPFKLSG